MNLNLFNDKQQTQPATTRFEYKIDTYAKEKIGVNQQTQRETEYFINLPIYNSLNFKDNNDKKVILNQVCSDLIGEIRENRINDAPRISLLKKEPYNKNMLFNLGKAHYSFDYLKNPNNKIESQCLLEFLNFIDFNLKNTISRDNDFTALYSKYEFLANNLIDNRLFFEILDETDINKNMHYLNFVENLKQSSNSNTDTNTHANTNTNITNTATAEDLNFNSLVMNLGLNSEKEEATEEASELKLEEISFNKHNNNANKSFLTPKDNLNKSVGYHDPHNQHHPWEKNKINNFNIHAATAANKERIKPFTANYSNNYGIKTTINSQDIDIINDLQPVKINSHSNNSNNNNNNLNFFKNQSLKKIFKSSNCLNNSSSASNNNVSNIINNTNKTAQTLQKITFENDFKINHHLYNNSTNNNSNIANLNSLNSNTMLVCQENKDFIISNTFTERILKNENNFPDLTEILKFNILDDNQERQFLLKQKKLKDEEPRKSNNLNNFNSFHHYSYENNNSGKRYNFTQKGDNIEDLELFDESVKRKKFLIQKHANQGQSNTKEAHHLNNIHNNSNNNNIQLKSSNDSINKELRKFKTDSIHKKIKVNILKYIKDFVVEYVPNKKIPNLSQDIVTNVNITYNKELLEKRLIDIYKEDFEKNNREAFAEIIDVMQYKSDFSEVMNMKLKDYIFEKYWMSDFHRNKLKRIFDLEHREYFWNYVNVDRDFINYFVSNRGNKKKGIKLGKPKKTFITSNIDIDVNNEVNNVSYSTE